MARSDRRSTSGAPLGPRMEDLVAENLRDSTPQELGQKAEVREHGEIGPMLVDQSQKFSGPKEG